MLSAKMLLRRDMLSEVFKQRGKVIICMFQEVKFGGGVEVEWMMGRKYNLVYQFKGFCFKLVMWCEFKFKVIVELDKREFQMGI